MTFKYQSVRVRGETQVAHTCRHVCAWAGWQHTGSGFDLHTQHPVGAQVLSILPRGSTDLWGLQGLLLAAHPGVSPPGRQVGCLGRTAGHGWETAGEDCPQERCSGLGRGQGHWWPEGLGCQGLWE